MERFPDFYIDDLEASKSSELLIFYYFFVKKAVDGTVNIPHPLSVWGVNFGVKIHPCHSKEGGGRRFTPKRSHFRPLRNFSV